MKNNSSKVILFALLLLMVNVVHAVGIKLNQIGFYVGEQKYAAVTVTGATAFEIIEVSSEKTVYTGQLLAAQNWSASGESVRIANFTDFTKTGTYKVKVGANTSYEFKIERKNLFRDLSIYSIKGFYFWRASTAIESKYAQFKNQNYARAFGHPDDKVYVHSSAASKERPTGTVISSPKGWYDAGDYNKYVVNAGIPIFSLLTSFEQYPEYYKRLSLNIPESSNSVPDVLDEAKWELDWLLSMQDPNDGGVYFKLTNLGFDGMNVMPANATNDRYVVKKTTTSALDFAAMMAMAARVFKEYETAFPGYAKQCEDAAIKAYNWAEKNPSIEFLNPSDVATGQYGDKSFGDEFTWARTELFISTGDAKYINQVSLTQSLNVPSWPNIAALGFVSLMQNLDKVALTAEQKASISSNFYSLVDGLVYTTKNSPYRIAMTKFDWGSNGDAGMQGLLLGSAWHFSQKKEYLSATISALDYILGRNAVDYSFVTGFGTKSPMNIHDRRSVADGIVDPIPGYVSGGPNASPAGDCGSPIEYTGAIATRWYDANCSYSTNEIAVNWNGPLAYLAGAVESQLSDPSLMPVATQVSENGTVITVSYEKNIADSKSLDTAYTLLANGVLMAIDTIYVSKLSSKDVIIQLKQAIKPEYNSLLLALRNENLVSADGISITPFDSLVVVNTVAGAAPVLLNAKILASGFDIKLKFSKKIAAVDSLQSGFAISSSKLVLGASVNRKDSTEVLLSVSEIKVTDNILLNYAGSSVKTTENSFLLAISNFPVINESAINPVQFVSAVTQSDGYSILLQTSRDIVVKTPVTGLSFTLQSSALPIKSVTASGKNILLTFNTRFYSNSKITLNYVKGSISAADGNVVDSIKNMVVTNTIPNNATYIVANTSAPVIEAENFDYKNGMQVEGGADKNLGYIGVGDWVDYSILVQDSGLYYINGQFASKKTTGVCQYQILTDNEPEILNSVSIPNTGDWTAWKVFSTPVRLKAGLHTLRLYATGAEFNITKFEISRKSAEISDAPVIDVTDLQVLVAPQIVAANQDVTIFITATIEQRKMIVSFVSLDGRVLQEETFANTKQIDLKTNFPTAGCYLVRVSAEGGSISKPIFVK